jgi:hypothetical protein
MTQLINQGGECLLLMLITCSLRYASNCYYCYSKCYFNYHQTTVTTTSADVDNVHSGVLAAITTAIASQNTVIIVTVSLTSEAAVISVVMIITAIMMLISLLLLL